MASCGVNWFSATPTAAPHVQLDLSAGWAQNLLFSSTKCMFTNAFYWISPPCGTLSKARNRPIPEHWQRMGVPMAPPLRSSRHLWGLPQALEQPELASKIFEANKLIEFAFELAIEAQKENRPWAIVNPEGSFIWEMHQWRQLKYHEWSFHACAFGGTRPFPRTVRGSMAALSEIGQHGRCNGKHTHRPWTPKFASGNFLGFSSRKESALPEAFCKRAAEIIRRETSGAAEKVSNAPKGMAETFITMAKIQAVSGDENKTRIALDAAAAGRQARGRRLQQLVPEYKRIAQSDAADVIRLAKRRRVNEFTDANGTKWPQDTQIVEMTEGGPSGHKTATMGIPWSKKEFFEEAKKVAHPFTTPPAPSEPDLAVFECITLGPDEVIARREAWFRKWESRAKQLEEQEDELAKSLHPDINIKGRARVKRPLLLREILRSTGFESPDLLFSMMTEGFPMFGEFPATGVFPKREHAATLTQEEALKTAKWARPATAARSRAAWGEGVEESLRQATAEELKQQECRGPFSAEEMDRRHPHGWLDGPRIPVVQRKGVRPCEHYSAYGQNSTSSACETVDTEGIDRILAMIKVWTRMLKADGKVTLTMPDGSVREGHRHPAYNRRDARKLLGRLLDLKRAYKQLSRAVKDSALSVFSLPGPNGGEPEYYEAVVLGFGARNAVLGFNYAARAVRHVANVGLYLAVTHFFDDFTQIDSSLLAENSAASLERLMDLLGWEFKKGPKDLKEHSSCFEPLGVSVDLSEFGTAVVKNTDRRKQAITEEITRLVSAKAIPAPEIASLLGVCQYMEAQTAGRTGALAMRLVRRASARRGPAAVAGIQKEIAKLGQHVARTAPRSVDLVSDEAPVLIFTDAASEPAGATFGAVIFDPRTLYLGFCAGRFTDAQVSRWRAQVGQQIICQAELAAVPVAICTWPEVVSNRPVLMFVDNDPAKDAAINGISTSEVSSRMVHEMRLLCTEKGIAPWFERVPSPSNIADPPSRGDFAELLALGACRVEPKILPAFEIEFANY